jgi:hypothetical protein
MTTKPPSRLAASGQADDPEFDDITKDHNEVDDDGPDDINVDPSQDVTVEATEDVTSEAASETPSPSLRPGAFGSGDTETPAPRAPTLLGVPIQSLPLPGVTASSLNGDDALSIDRHEDITVLAPPMPGDPLAALDALDAFDRPSITDDDEEETKVEPAETAMKAAETMDDVTTALSAQASLEREKALRRTMPPPSVSSSDDLEFADPEADEDDDAEESLDDELSDEDEVISAGGAIEEEEDIDDDADTGAGEGDGVATATFLKPADSTGLSGLLNPRRPPTGGRDGFGSRLPTPYSQATAPAPSTSPFASRLGAAPAGAPYSTRATGTGIPAIQLPPPAADAPVATEPGFFARRLPVPGYALISLIGGAFVLGFGVHALTSSKAPAPVVAARPVAAPAPAAAPVVVPVAPAQAGPEVKPTTPPAEAAKPAPTIADLPAGDPIDRSESAEAAKPKKPAAKPHKPAAVVDPLDETAPKPAVAKPTVAATPKPAAAKTKKPAKVWVDPFAN